MIERVDILPARQGQAFDSDRSAFEIADAVISLPKFGFQVEKTFLRIRGCGGTLHNKIGKIG